MKLHEYESKKILKKYGLKCPPGILIDANNLLDEKVFFENEILLNVMLAGYVVKAQVLSGGRGKSGGIKFASCIREVENVIKEMLDKKLITPQNPKGEIVKTILIEQKLPIEKEFYVSFVIDRNIGKPVFIVSSCGGTEIEEIAKTIPEKILKIAIEPVLGLQEFQLRQAADFLGLKDSVRQEFMAISKTLFELFTQKDLLTLEINPLALSVNPDKTNNIDTYELVCIDAKMIVDDYALFRQPEFQKIKESRESEEQGIEAEAKKAGLNYIPISNEEGIGMFSNGAGLGLDTLDRVKEAGANLASFLDLGGAITTEQIELTLKFMNNEPKIKIIFGNIYTALLGAGKISDALLKALNESNLQKPIILRLEGRGADKSIAEIQKHNFHNFYVYRTIEESVACLLKILKNESSGENPEFKKTTNGENPDSTTVSIPKTAFSLKELGIDLNKNTRVIIQGLGKGGKLFGKMMLDFGMNIIAGVAPGKKGQIWENIPLFNSVEEIIQNIGKPEATIIFVPAGQTKDSLLEAAYSEIPVIVCITEGVPVRDIILVKSYIAGKKIILVGPNCPGIIVPEECDISIHPYEWYKKGEVALLSRSGSLSYEIATRLWQSNIGVSIITGIGGDMVPGSTFVDWLKIIKDNESTKAVILIGEIGSCLEQNAADYIALTNYPKPIMLYIPGIHAPEGKRMGHAGAIISSHQETALAKLKYFEEKGFLTCRNYLKIGELAKKLLNQN